MEFQEFFNLKYIKTLTEISCLQKKIYSLVAVHLASGMNLFACDFTECKSKLRLPWVPGLVFLQTEPCDVILGPTSAFSVMDSSDCSF